MDDMLERVNNWLNELSIPDIAKFVAEFKQPKDDIAMLYKQLLPLTYDLVLVISDKEEVLVDLMDRTLKDKGK